MSPCITPFRYFALAPVRLKVVRKPGSNATSSYLARIVTHYYSTKPRQIEIFQGNRGSEAALKHASALTMASVHRGIGRKSR